MSDKFEAMIFAYSLGCLNEDNRKEFERYLASGEEFNFSELGEIQNLAALIPCALELQQVNPKVKDNVARRLYGLRNDIRKIRAQYKSIEEQEPETPQQEEISEQQSNTAGSQDEILMPSRSAETQRPSHHTQIMGRESGNLYTPYSDASTTSTSNEVNRTSEIVNDASEFYQGPKAPAAETSKKGYGWMILSFILFFVVVLGIVFIYFRLTADLKNTKKEVDELKRQRTTEVNHSTGSSEVQQILQSPNSDLVNLKGTSVNPSGYGKLFIDSETGKGLIQFSQMPALEKDEFYVLWMQISGKFIRLGEFNIGENLAYYPFNIIKTDQNSRTNFLVTKENTKDAKRPGSKLYLSGNL